MKEGIWVGVCVVLNVVFLLVFVWVFLVKIQGYSSVCWWWLVLWIVLLVLFCGLLNQLLEEKTILVRCSLFTRVRWGRLTSHVSSLGEYILLVEDVFKCSLVFSPKFNVLKMVSFRFCWSWYVLIFDMLAHRMSKTRRKPEKQSYSRLTIGQLDLQHDPSGKKSTFQTPCHTKSKGVQGGKQTSTRQYTGFTRRKVMNNKTINHQPTQDLIQHGRFYLDASTVWNFLRKVCRYAWSTCSWFGTWRLRSKWDLKGTVLGKGYGRGQKAPQKMAFPRLFSLTHSPFWNKVFRKVTLIHGLDPLVFYGEFVAPSDVCVVWPGCSVVVSTGSIVLTIVS